ncbi:F-box domain-containing protein [Mycena sanguinolenta]|uniref:F-box domain-containing protein n=1 Tax=Mycena sanguinolenta TaxID=230812 RepID=A0A8H6XRA7_9AGAR|nr:F-box domain-containing protein [Mycena sanguinolenta]
MSSRSKYIVSPIRTLPAELLAEIFEYTIGDSHVKDAHRVSQVCSNWRQVAHSTPRLWTQMLDVALCKKGDTFSHCLKAWLARSAPLPVHISFTSVDHGDINPGILEEVLKVALRWGSLKMPKVATMPLSLVRRLAQCRLDCLEELDLGTIAEYEDATPVVFTAVPRLRKFSVVNPGTTPIVVPWAQLTELTLDWDSPVGVFQALTQCTNLITVSIQMYGWSRLPEIGQDLPVEFSQLNTFCLDLSMKRPAFLDYLSTPVLQKLQLFLNGVSWSQTHLTAFQLRAPNITFLEFTHAWLTSDDLVAAVRHAPLLTHLKLTGCRKCFKDEFIHALHYHDDATPLAPCLQSLEVLGSVMNFTEDVLAGMIASRWWTDIELATNTVRPAAARWTSVVLQFGGFGHNQYHFSPRFADIVKDMPSDVLKYRKDTT